mmetsp:Transcript_28428/g.78332  ORF Transcript_28428/g.78332 Transcript_28428/m.78332 type:complete len:267 (+) Transcript_28428:134-934(+)
MRLTRCDTENTFLVGCCTTRGCQSLHIARTLAPSTSFDVMRRRPLIESTPLNILGGVTVSWLRFKGSMETSTFACEAKWTSSYGVLSATFPVMRGSYWPSSHAPLLRPPMNDRRTAPPPWSTKLIRRAIRWPDGVHGASTNATSTWSMLMALASPESFVGCDLAKMFSKMARPPRNSISSATRVAAVMLRSTSWSFLASVSTEYMTAQTRSLNGFRGRGGPIGQSPARVCMLEGFWSMLLPHFRCNTFAQMRAIFGIASTCAALTT